MEARPRPDEPAAPLARLKRRPKERRTPARGAACYRSSRRRAVGLLPGNPEAPTPLSRAGPRVRLLFAAPRLGPGASGLVFRCRARRRRLRAASADQARVLELEA